MDYAKHEAQEFNLDLARTEDRIVAKILADLRGRGGLSHKWDDIDKETQLEIVATWKGLALEALPEKQHGITPKLRALLNQYKSRLADYGPVRHDNPNWNDEWQEHLQWMIALMLGETSDTEGKKPVETWSDRKINRWLGYIQGSLQVMGLATIYGLREQTRDLYVND